MAHTDGHTRYTHQENEQDWRGPRPVLPTRVAISLDDAMTPRRGPAKARKAAQKRQKAERKVLSEIHNVFADAQTGDCWTGWLGDAPCPCRTNVLWDVTYHDIQPGMTVTCPVYGQMTEASLVALWRQVWKTQRASARYQDAEPATTTAGTDPGSWYTSDTRWAAMGGHDGKTP